MIKLTQFSCAWYLDSEEKDNIYQGSFINKFVNSKINNELILLFSSSRLLQAVS